jgi:hypothetical protein
VQEAQQGERIADGVTLKMLPLDLSVDLTPPVFWV